MLFESGFGATSEAWFKVQPVIAHSTRACAYDRAGYGLSDPGPLPRDGEAIARDLDRGLRAGGIQGPYILVGHSAGGLYMRLFAARRRADIRGILLVDPSVEYQDKRIAAILGPDTGSLAPIRARVAKCLAAATRIVVSTDGDAECPSPLLGRGARDPEMQAAWRTQASELDMLFTDTSDQVSRIGGLLRDVPFVVLTASPAPPPPAPQDSYSTAWQHLHRELANGFLAGQQKVVQSSHLMMIERPEVVTNAILDLVASARRQPRGNR